MGFFKKIFKGIKKVIKKIGKGIKSAFKKVGKFMGKIGIIGQIGLALVLPGVGQMLSGLLVGTTPGVVGGLAGTLQGMGAVGQAASSFIQGAVKVASNTSQFFSSVTDGVTKVVGDTIGAAAQNLGITAESTLGQNLSKLGVNMDVDGWGGVFTNAEKSFGKITEAGSNIFNISQPVGDPTATALAQKQTQITEQVSEGLQPKAESMTTFDVTSPVGETVVQTPKVSAPAVTDESLLRQTTAEGVAQEAAKDALEEGKFFDRVSKTLTGKTVDENLTVGRAKIAEAVTDFIPETGKALGREALAQVTGLSPTPEQLRPIAYSSSVALGDFETSIGMNDYATSPYQSVIDQVGPQYAMSHPYGLMSQQYNFNQYLEQARARGVAA